MSQSVTGAGTTGNIVDGIIAHQDRVLEAAAAPASSDTAANIDLPPTVEKKKRTHKFNGFAKPFRPQNWVSPVPFPQSLSTFPSVKCEASAPAEASTSLVLHHEAFPHEASNSLVLYGEAASFDAPTVNTLALPAIPQQDESGFSYWPVAPYPQAMISAPMIGPLVQTFPPPSPVAQLPGDFNFNNGYNMGQPFPEDLFSGEDAGPPLDKRGRLQPFYYVPDGGEVFLYATRHLKLTNIPPTVSIFDLKKTLESFGDIASMYIDKFFTQQCIFVSYFDLRDAVKCERELAKPWSAKFCGRSILEHVFQQYAAHPVGIEGKICVDIVKRIPDRDSRCEGDIIRNFFSTAGPVISVESAGLGNCKAFIVEYSDVRHCQHAITLFDNYIVHGCHLHIRHAEVERHCWVNGSQMITVNEDFNLAQADPQLVENIVSELRRETEQVGVMVSQKEESTTSSKTITPPDSDEVKALATQADNRLAVVTVQATPGKEVVLRSHNRRRSDERKRRDEDEKEKARIIDLVKVKNGGDLRTSIMIRNIPNRLDQLAIKTWVDEFSHRKYDFFYLRIDFNNGFFVERVSGLDWRRFSSDKIVDVTYADIQGKASLIERFRNSNIMDNKPAYQPLVFHTSGPDSGRFEEFPKANNLCRKLKSATSAATNGGNGAGSASGNWRNRGNDNTRRGVAPVKEYFTPAGRRDGKPMIITSGPSQVFGNKNVVSGPVRVGPRPEGISGPQQGSVLAPVPIQLPTYPQPGSFSGTPAATLNNASRVTEEGSPVRPVTAIRLDPASYTGQAYGQQEDSSVRPATAIRLDPAHYSEQAYGRQVGSPARPATALRLDPAYYSGQIHGQKSHGGANVAHNIYAGQFGVNPFAFNGGQSIPRGGNFGNRGGNGFRPHGGRN
ncbi:hypothetical protein DRE_06215 [Drechslerella stenobrocha 248]|uniref:RRM domain-containing protein n=1 Tax=Drechslerella stenobrocha 248 TaxID=1043628 RepID=W7HM66_9PEZI|nr:hypothetical protein DRE_06215 [Drechslerella stenobrocha 248]